MYSQHEELDKDICISVIFFSKCLWTCGHEQSLDMSLKSACLLTLTVLVATIDAQWEGDGRCRVGEVRAGTTSPMPDHKGFKLH